MPHGGCTLVKRTRAMKRTRASERKQRRVAQEPEWPCTPQTRLTQLPLASHSFRRWGACSCGVSDMATMLGTKVQAGHRVSTTGSRPLQLEVPRGAHGWFQGPTKGKAKRSNLVFNRQGKHAHCPVVAWGAAALHGISQQSCLLSHSPSPRGRGKVWLRRSQEAGMGC